MTDFDIDPDNPNSVFGWGLLRVQPWHFVGLYATAAEAHAARENFAADYIVRHGSMRMGRVRFRQPGQSSATALVFRSTPLLALL